MPVKAIREHQGVDRKYIYRESPSIGQLYLQGLTAFCHATVAAIANRVRLVVTLGTKWCDAPDSSPHFRNVGVRKVGHAAVAKTCWTLGPLNPSEFCRPSQTAGTVLPPSGQKYHTYLYLTNIT